MVGGVCDGRLDGNFCIILGVDSGGFMGAVICLSMFFDILFDEALLVHLIDDALSVCNEGSHCCVYDGEVDERGESEVFDAERCT